MKIAWFTPVTGDDPVVEYSRGVLAAMDRVCQPVLCCNRPPERFPNTVRVLDFEAQPEAFSELASFDAAFYNLGNDLEQHAWIFEASQRQPGIVVLHGWTLHRFFLDYYLRHLHRVDLYISRMAEHYGLAGLTTVHRVLGPHLDADIARDEDLVRYPFTEEALRSAPGVVVHSRWHGALVRRRWSGPVCEAWPPPQRPTASSIPTRTHGEDLDQRRITLLTLGPVNPRAGVAEVIDVLAQDPELAARTRYVIAGGPDHPDAYERELTARIADAGLEGSVRMLGRLQPVELDQWARAADVFISLRHPGEEGLAMELMYQLPFGKPLVTRDDGPLAEIPDGALVKLAMGDRAGLRRSLNVLVDCVASRRAIGSAGKRFADRHGAGDYAQTLLRFAGQASGPIHSEATVAEPGSLEVAERIAIHVGQTLSGLGASLDSPGVAP